MYIPDIGIVWDSERVAFRWARPNALSYPLKPHVYCSSCLNLVAVILSSVNLRLIAFSHLASFFVYILPPLFLTGGSGIWADMFASVCLVELWYCLVAVGFTADALRGPFRMSHFSGSVYRGWSQCKSRWAMMVAKYYCGWYFL